MTQSLINFVRATARPFLSYILVGACVGLVFVGIPVPGELWTAASMSLAFWFADRKTAPPSQS